VGKGSLIWKATSQHKAIIQQDSFWEIRDGNNAHFLDDSWHQRPKLSDLIRPHQTQEWEEHQMDKVSQHWTPTLKQGYRQWISTTHIIRQGTESIHKNLEIELINRKIHFSDKKDIIRWGYNACGIFTTQEACKPIVGNQTVKDPLWDKVWFPNIWPKVSTFLWLLCQNKIVTWDNLRKRSFHGPSICPNRKQQEETILHLMNSCNLKNKL